jgi:hypothetical protein
MKGMRTRTPGKQAALSAVGIEVTPVVGSGTENEKEARNYINKGERARRRTRRDKTTGDWVIIERDGAMLHIGECGEKKTRERRTRMKVVLVSDRWSAYEVHEVRRATGKGAHDSSDDRERRQRRQHGDGGMEAA